MLAPVQSRGPSKVEVVNLILKNGTAYWKTYMSKRQECKPAVQVQAKHRVAGPERVTQMSPRFPACRIIFAGLQETKARPLFNRTTMCFLGIRVQAFALSVTEILADRVL